MKKIDYDKEAKLFKALAHPTRLLIAHKLLDKELCVCEINEFVDIEQPTLSRHLKMMKDAGVLLSEKKGMSVFYRLKYPCFVQNIMKCLYK